LLTGGAAGELVLRMSNTYSVLFTWISSFRLQLIRVEERLYFNELHAYHAGYSIRRVPISAEKKTLPDTIVGFSQRKS